MNLKKISAYRLGLEILNKNISPLEVLDYSLKLANENKYNEFITVAREYSKKQCDEAIKKISEGVFLSPLMGLPMAIKDNIVTKDIKTTCGSKMLSNFIPRYDSYVNRKISVNGGILIGKTNMDEFAMGSTSENSYFGSVINPLDEKRVVGGSSGGSAVSVLNGDVFYALGSDTGGSIINPCSYCGLVGIKPTYGKVSRYGLIAYASSMDQIGVIGRCTRDLAEGLKIIGGYDKKDGTSIDFFDQIINEKEDLKGIRVGLPIDFIKEYASTSVYNTVINMAKKLEELGCEIVEIKLRYTDYFLPAYYIIACAEVSSNLSRYDGVRYGFRADNITNLEELYIKSRSLGFSDEVKRRILMGTFVLSTGFFEDYYKKAYNVRGAISLEYKSTLKDLDAILMPSTPTTAPYRNQFDSNPLNMYKTDIFTVGNNLSGLPSVTLPCGFDEFGLPVGGQLIGNINSDFKLLEIGRVFEANTKYNRFIN